MAATLQTANFGRVYATYGGIFIVLSLLWAWEVDNFKPDRYDQHICQIIVHLNATAKIS